MNIDLEYLLDIFGEIGIIKDVLHSTIDFLKTETSELEKNIKNQNSEEIENIAHKIKGASAQCGLCKVSEVAKKIEILIRANKNISTNQLLNLLDQLKQNISIASSEIQNI